VLRRLQICELLSPSVVLVQVGCSAGGGQQQQVVPACLPACLPACMHVTLPQGWLLRRPSSDTLISSEGHSSGNKDWLGRRVVPRCSVVLWRSPLPFEAILSVFCGCKQSVRQIVDIPPLGSPRYLVVSQHPIFCTLCSCVDVAKELRTGRKTVPPVCVRTSRYTQEYRKVRWRQLRLSVLTEVGLVTWC
jgi:hypothetical protein